MTTIRVQVRVLDSEDDAVARRRELQIDRNTARRLGEEAVTYVGQGGTPVQAVATCPGRPRSRRPSRARSARDVRRARPTAAPGLDQQGHPVAGRAHLQAGRRDTPPGAMACLVHHLRRTVRARTRAAEGQRPPRRPNRPASSRSPGPTDTRAFGAWGCGAFANDPDRTARDFRKRLEESGAAFEHVVFAIADWSRERHTLGPFVAACAPGG